MPGSSQSKRRRVASASNANNNSTRNVNKSKCIKITVNGYEIEIPNIAAAKDLIDQFTAPESASAAKEDNYETEAIENEINDENDGSESNLIENAGFGEIAPIKTRNIIANRRGNQAATSKTLPKDPKKKYKYCEGETAWGSVKLLKTVKKLGLPLQAKFVTPFKIAFTGLEAVGIRLRYPALSKMFYKKMYACTDSILADISYYVDVEPRPANDMKKNETWTVNDIEAKFIMFGVQKNVQTLAKFVRPDDCMFACTFIFVFIFIFVLLRMFFVFFFCFF